MEIPKHVLEIANYAITHVPMYAIENTHLSLVKREQDFLAMLPLTPKMIAKHPMRRTVRSLDSDGLIIYEGFTADPYDSIHLLDNDDFVHMSQNLEFLLSDPNEGEEEPEPMTFVTNPDTRDALAFLSSLLQYWGSAQTAFDVFGLSEDQIQKKLEQRNPEWIFVGDDYLPASCVPKTDCEVYTFNFPDQYEGDEVRHLDFFEQPYIGIIGLLEDGAYTYNPENFFIEEHDGDLLFTSLKYKHQPVIRYSPGIQGRLLEEGKFEVEW